MPAAEPRGGLDHLRPARADAQLRVRGSVLDPECLDRTPGHLGGRLGVRRRPDVGERDAEGGRLGGDAVGDRQRHEAAARREADHRHLGPVDVFLDERDAGARRPPREREGLVEVGAVEDERESLLSLPVGRFHHARGSELRLPVTDRLPPRLRHAGGRERLTLSQLVRREHGGRRSQRVREAELGGDARGDRDGPVGSRRDQAVGLERGGEPLDRRLVLGRDEAAAGGELEAGRGRVAVADGRPDPVRTRSLEQPELRRARA